MPQVSPRHLDEETAKKIYDLFFKSLLKSKTKKEVKDLLDSLLTPTEKVMLAKRIAIFYLLLKKVDHRTICHLLKVSSSTVAKFAIILNIQGKGTEKIIKKLIREREVANALLTIGELLFDDRPPLGTDWSKWRTEQRKRKRNNLL